MSPGARPLYYDDSYLRRFEARVLAAGADPRRVKLDRTAFYPASGGQPHDTGAIGEARVVDVVAADDEAAGAADIVHVLDRPLAPGSYACEIDWTRRFDHMQQHSGQHLLSAVLADRFGIPTVSFHLGAEASTIDVEAAQLDAKVLVEVERLANEAVFENRPIAVSYRDGAEPGLGLRKPTGRTGTIRVVTIEGLDRGACGGTHVASTGAIGALLLRKLDRIRGNVRIEFLCGARAVARARADFDTLSAAARTYSAPLDQVPALAAAQAERLADAGREARKLAVELAGLRGQSLHAATAPNAAGRRVHVRELPAGPIDDALRAEAQSFAARGGAAFAVLCGSPPSILLCVSPDSPVKAGPVLKAALDAVGGRGGGNAAMAQGSVPTAEALHAVWTSVQNQI